MPADAEASSPSVPDLQQRIDKLEAELRARTAGLDEALQREAAVASVLQVINASGGNLAPVFDVMLEKATALCEADAGVFALRRGDGRFDWAAEHGFTSMPEFAREPMTPHPESGVGRVVSGETIVHILDSASGPAFESGEAGRRAIVELGGARTQICVALRKNSALLGAFVIWRREVRPFAESQIALLQNFAAQAVIAMENARLLGELRQRTDALTESLEYQTATSELLEVISRSTSDVQPVLDTMLASASRLCGVHMGAVSVRKGDALRYVATIGVTESYDEYLRGTPQQFDRRTGAGRAMVTKEVTYIPDVQADPEYSMTETTTLGGFRSLLAVPLLRDDEAIGAITLGSNEPLKDRQIALVKTFADQAVIAMENARLIREQREALEQQTATTEVLEVINASPGDLGPVFDAMLEKAMHLCEADFGTFAQYDGEFIHGVAYRGVSVEFIEATREPFRPTPNGPFLQSVQTGSVFQVPDLADSDSYRSGAFGTKVLVETGGARTAVWVPLRKEDQSRGALVMYRKEARLFSDKQIALLQNFAAQAVIAMENARLLTEQREALDRQQATAEVLQVINSSLGQVEPVFDALLEKATSFCEAAFGILWTYDDENFHAAAFREVPPAYAEYLRNPPPLTPETPLGRIAAGESVVHILDLAAHALEHNPLFRQAVELGGFRTILGVALRKEGTLLGAITIYRQETRQFSDKQVSLLQNFAAQAVIAMDNARLLDEIRQRQAELRVTFDNMGDGVAMFDADLRLAAWNRNFQRIMGVDEAYLAERPTYAAYLGRLAERGEFGTANVESELANRLEHTDRELRLERRRPDGTVIEVRRNAVPGGGFVLIYSDITERKKAEVEIAAARDAAEAALERQTATADILKVIASSPSDTRPAFEAIAHNANRLLEGLSTTVWRLEGDAYKLAAFTSTTPDADRALNAMASLPRVQGDILAPSVGEGIRMVTDTETGPLFMREIARLRGFRACMAASLTIEGQSIGFVNVTHREPGPFKPDDVQLLKTFADQAVIAIQNARLFNELREALEQQTATADILRVISQSPTDVSPVLTAVAKAALKFCGASDAIVGLRDGDQWRIAAHEGPIEAPPGAIRPLNRQSPLGRAIVDSRIVQVTDLQSAEGDEYPYARAIAARVGFRSSLAAPLLRDGAAIGAISLRRPETGAYTLNQVELLKSFAAQAVIAIENVRLFTELRDSLERLKAAQANLIQAEKMASLGQLTAGIAHEIKNPLNFVNNFAGLSGELVEELKQGVEAMLAEPDDDKRAELQETMALLTGNLAKIIEHGRRADGIVKSMLTHSRGGAGDWQTSNINGLAEEALNLAYHGARAQDQNFNVTLERAFDEALKPIDVVPQDVTRVFLNLIGNGFYATRKRQQDNGEDGYQPTLRVLTRDLGEAVEVLVRDNGTGISREVRDKLFQPFFTTKPTGEGTGLGLSISYDIVTQQHGGSIEVESEVGQYTEFTVRLPRARRAAAGGS